MASKLRRPYDAPGQPMQLRPDLLDISPDNVRHHEIVEGVDELARSMDEIGLQQPIVVQPKEDGFEVLIGQRRLLAARQLGWPEIPGVVLPERVNNLEAKVLSYIENSHRRDLTPRDKSDVCKFLLDELGSVANVADKLRVSENTVRKWLGYAAVPEPIKHLVDRGEISHSVATRIYLNVEDEGKAIEIAERVAGLAPAERTRVVDTVEEMPTRSVDVILEKAKERQFEKQITFVLPQRWSEAVEQAAKDRHIDANTLAREATIEWLVQNKY